MDYMEVRRSNLTRRILMGAAITAVLIFMVRRSPSAPSHEFSQYELGVNHVLVTGGAGYIGSYAVLRLLNDSYRITIADNLSRGNMRAVKILKGLYPEPGKLQFIYDDLDDDAAVEKIFSQNAFDAVTYVGESTVEPLRYYHNNTSNTLLFVKAMAAYRVKTLIYSSTCATYGETDKMPIKEETPQVPINPYSKAKKTAEDMILDFS